MSQRKIQPTLFTFWSTKEVKHREEKVNISLLLRAEEPIPGNFLWSHFPKRFKNTVGLSVKVKYTNGHNVVTKSNPSNKLAVTSHKL